MRKVLALVALMVSLAVVTVGMPVAAEKYKGFERGDALITVGELKQLMDTKDSKLLVLAVVKPMSYMAGHIPGSINVWRPDYEPKVGRPYPFKGM